MREYILTEKERETVKKFLQDKASNELIRLLRYRARQHLDSLKEDIELLEELMQ